MVFDVLYRQVRQIERKHFLSTVVSRCLVPMLQRLMIASVCEVTTIANNFKVLDEIGSDRPGVPPLCHIFRNKEIVGFVSVMMNEAN